jgi:NRPS condensation-like uncharacterized protein
MPTKPPESYSLTPLQQGMLFHHLSDRHSGVDIEQLVLTLPEKIDAAALRAAWAAVVGRHDVLRTSFRWDAAGTAVQHVHPDVRLPFETEDWRELDPASQETRWDEFLRADRQAGFSLQDAPLLRLLLVRLEENRFQLLWTFHHIILDGR